MATAGVFYDPFKGRFEPSDDKAEIGSSAKPVNAIHARTVTADSVVGAVTGTASAVSGTVAATSLTIPAPVVTTADTIAVGSSPSGTTFFATKTSATQVFTLPTASPGLSYTFVCGHADGEINILPSAASQTITGVGFAVAHPAGIENDAGSNVVGDAVTLVAVSATAWVATSTIGTWSTTAS